MTNMRIRESDEVLIFKVKQKIERSVGFKVDTSLITSVLLLTDWYNTLPVTLNHYGVLDNYKYKGYYLVFTKELDTDGHVTETEVIKRQYCTYIVFFSVNSGNSGVIDCRVIKETKLRNIYMKPERVNFRSVDSKLSFVKEDDLVFFDSIFSHTSHSIFINNNKIGFKYI